MHIMYYVPCIMYILCSLGACPEPLGPPPQGSWGASQGGSRAQTTNTTSRYRTPVLCPISMSILKSFFGPFRCRLGPLLGSLLGLRLALGRSKLVPSSSSKCLIFEKVVLHEIMCFTILLGGFCLHMGPQNAPRWCQDGSLVVLDRFFSLLEFSLGFCIVLGSVWDRFGVPKWCP